MIRDAGFKSVMLRWMDNDDITISPKEKQPEEFRKHGLEIANIHMPFFQINNLWGDNVDGCGMYEVLASCIIDCGEHDIPTAVAHLSIGNTPPPPNDIGLDRVKRLVELCEKNSVNIAFENVRRPDYLDFVFSRVESDCLKFCYDSGHEYAFGTEDKIDPRDKRLTDSPELMTSIDRYLSLMERFCVGVNAKIYDIHIFSHMAGGKTIIMYDCLSSIIEHKRRKSNRESIYCEFENTVKELKSMRWNERRTVRGSGAGLQELEKTHASRQFPGI